jgi:hypothetical protein
MGFTLCYYVTILISTYDAQPNGISTMGGALVLQACKRGQRWDGGGMAYIQALQKNSLAQAV